MPPSRFTRYFGSVSRKRPAAFMGWLEQRCHERKPDGGLQIMYGLHGEHELPEITLDHLDGYRGCKPVRVGNGAADQLQLDIYGELMDSVYLYNKHGTPISLDLWKELSGLVEWVCKNWRRPDEGIWETRGGQQHFVYSKLMCWVCLDRALRLAEKRSLPADRGKWLKVPRRNLSRHHEERLVRKTNRLSCSPTAAKSLDASNLIMPLVFFMAPTTRGCSARSTRSAGIPSDGGLLSTASSIVTTSSSSPTDWPAARARSTCARSGSSRR